MKRLTDKKGLTLLEIVVSVAIIVVLTSIVIGTAVRIETRSKEQLMENTFALLNAALAEFKDYGFNYDPEAYGNNEREFYLSLDFPVDCNDYVKSSLEEELDKAFGAAGGTTINPPIGHPAKYSGCEAMYFMLRRVPKCRQILDKIDDSLITNSDPNIVELKIWINNEVYPLDRVIDPWGETLQYDYYDETLPLTDMKKSKRTFPVLTSAGADGIFGTSDDMKSRKR